MSLDQRIGHRVRAERSRLGLTQLKLCARMEFAIQPSQLSQLERGGASWMGRHIELAAAAFGMEPWELLKAHDESSRTRSRE